MYIILCMLLNIPLSKHYTFEDKTANQATLGSGHVGEVETIFYTTVFLTDTPGNKELLLIRAIQELLRRKDLNMIRNQGNRPPSRNEIAQRLIRNCYGLLLNRIKSGVNFN